MHELTLLVPAKFESESLPIVLTELRKFNFEILIVCEENDQETINSTKGYECSLLYQKSKGYGAALVEGIEKINTEYLCIFNADGSFDPKYLIEMLDECKNNNDFIFSSRYSKNGGTQDDTILTYVGNRIFSFIGKFFFRLGVDDILYTFVLGKTNSFKKLNIRSKDFRFCVELPILAKRSQMKIQNMGSLERKRFKGEKKVNEFKDGFLILIEMIRLFFK